MFRRTTAFSIIALVALVGFTAPAAAQVCEAQLNGRLANVTHGTTALFWDPVVSYDRMVLTISGPCEEIVRVYDSRDDIVFDIRDVKRIVDGQYTWELRRVAKVDKGVQQNLTEARGSGEEEDLWWNYFQAGKLPDGPFVDTGSFSVLEGRVIDPASGNEKVATAEGDSLFSGLASAGVGTAATGQAQAGSGVQTKVVLTGANGVIRNSLCVGFDCVNSPAFGDSTIILEENNTRIKFADSSSVNSFPRRDWEIEANSNLNGGLSYLAFNDCGDSDPQGSCANDPVFGVEGGARQHALWVESDGDVGIGTQNPVTEIHAVRGDTPTLRLEQDNSSGFAPQTWDVAGNETSFFIRDATNGSTLPFRIRPGAASNRLVIDADGDVGVGILSPEVDFHILATGEAATDVQFKIEANTDPAFDFEEQDSGVTWRFINNNTVLKIADVGTGADGAEELTLNQDGDLTISGEIFTSGSCVGGCDYAFDPDNTPESIEEHAEYMWTYRHLPSVGPTAETGKRNLSQMTGGMLNELEKAHIYIEELHQRLEQQSAESDELAERLARLEAALVER